MKFKLVLPRTGVDLSDYVTGYSVSESFAGFPQGSIHLAQSEIHKGQIAPAQKQLVKWTYPLEGIELFLDNNRILQGYITKQAISDNGNININVAGWTHNLTVSDIGPITIAKGELLSKSLLKALGPFGYTKVEFANCQDVKVEGAKSESDTSPMDYCRQLVKDAGLMFAQGAEKHVIKVCLPSYDGSPVGTLYRTYEGSNVAGLSVDRDWTDVATEAKAKARIGITAESSTWASSGYIFFGADEIPGGKAPEVMEIAFGTGGNLNKILTAKPNPPIQGNFGMIYRPRYFNSDKAKTKTAVENRLKREIGKMLAETLTARASITGHQLDWVFLRPDMIVNLKDEVGLIDENMWVQGVSYSNQSGLEQTEINLTRKYCII